MPSRTIATDADIAEGLAFLVGRDRRLAVVVEAAGTVPLRRLEPGFAGLARIVVGQQLSVASASAIWTRLAARFPDLDVARIGAAADDELRGAGLSGAKIATFRALAAAASQGFDPATLAAIPAGEAHRRLTAIRGIGPWTADLYLLFSLGHPDIFPAGDLALRKAVADAFGHGTPVSPLALARIAGKWSPWRGVAARLFFAYYRARRGIAATP